MAFGVSSQRTVSGGLLMGQCVTQTPGQRKFGWPHPYLGIGVEEPGCSEPTTRKPQGETCHQVTESLSSRE